MNKYLYLFCAVLLLLGTSCQNEGSSKAKATQHSDSILNLPPLPEERRMALYRNTIAIDVIAYELGISLSYNNPSSIQPVLNMIKPSQGKWLSACKAIGRISFMTENGVGEEAEMLIHQGCKTFVWLDNGQKAFMNELTDEGRDFWNNFIPADGQVKLPEGSQATPK